MKRLIPLLLVTALGTGGCGLLLDLLRPTRTSVILRNNGAFPVDARLFISSIQEIPELLLIADTSRALDYTVQPDGQVLFSRDCDDLQAIILFDADLRIIGQVGPATSTGVLRDGDEFGCGDTIVFTFDHSELLVDFDVTVTVESFSVVP